MVYFPFQVSKCIPEKASALVIPPPQMELISDYWLGPRGHTCFTHKNWQEKNDPIQIVLSSSKLN